MFWLIVIISHWKYHIRTKTQKIWIKKYQILLEHSKIFDCIFMSFEKPFYVSKVIKPWFIPIRSFIDATNKAKQSAAFVCDEHSFMLCIAFQPFEDSVDWKRTVANNNRHCTSTLERSKPCGICFVYNFMRSLAVHETYANALLTNTFISRRWNWNEHLQSFTLL